SSPRRVRSAGAVARLLLPAPWPDESPLVSPSILASQWLHRVPGRRPRAVPVESVLPDALSCARNLRSPRPPGRASVPWLRPWKGGRTSGSGGGDLGLLANHARRGDTGGQAGVMPAAGKTTTIDLS